MKPYYRTKRGNFIVMKGKHWTQKEVDLLKKYRSNNKNIKEISFLLNKSISSIKSKISILRLPKYKLTLEEIPYKRCLFCQKQIPKDCEVGKYRKRKYCSSKCAASKPVRGLYDVKKCVKCGELLTLNNFYFRKTGYFDSYCKKCEQKSSKRYYHRRKSQI